jgi:hypothetical protein
LPAIVFSSSYAVGAKFVNEKFAARRKMLAQIGRNRRITASTEAPVKLPLASSASGRRGV